MPLEAHKINTLNYCLPLMMFASQVEQALQLFTLVLVQ